jgi:hypothetical protein
MIRISSTILFYLLVLLVQPLVAVAQNTLPLQPKAPTVTADNGNGIFVKTVPVFYGRLSNRNYIFFNT